MVKWNICSVSLCHKNFKLIIQVGVADFKIWSFIYKFDPKSLCIFPKRETWRSFQNETSCFNERSMQLLCSTCCKKSWVQCNSVIFLEVLLMNLCTVNMHAAYVAQPTVQWRMQTSKLAKRNKDAGSQGDNLCKANLFFHQLMCVTCTWNYE